MNTRQQNRSQRPQTRSRSTAPTSRSTTQRRTRNQHTSDDAPTTDSSVSSYSPPRSAPNLPDASYMGEILAIGLREFRAAERPTVPLPPTFGAAAIPNFNPEDEGSDVDVWLTKVDQLAEVLGWSQAATAVNALSKLAGPALQWYKNIKDIQKTWDEWKDLLAEYFPSEKDDYTMHMAMTNRVKKDNETYVAYYYDKLALLTACGKTGREAVSFILGGIKNETVLSGAYAAQFSRPAELYSYLRRFPNVKSTTTSTSSTDAPSRNSNDRFHPYQKSKEKPTRECRKCGRKGHRTFQCRTVTSNPKSSFDPRPESEKGPEKRKCFLCGLVGHLQKNCRRAKKNGQEQRVQMVNSKPINESTDSKYNKPVILLEQKFDSYVDFGSKCSIVTESVAKSLKLSVDASNCVYLNGYGGGRVRTLGLSQSVKIQIDEVTANVCFNVVHDEVQPMPVLLGQSFTEQPHVLVIKTPTDLQFRNFKCKRVELRVARDVYIPGKHLFHVPIISDTDFEGEVVIESSERKEYSLPSVVLTLPSVENAVLPVLNTSEDEICLKKGRLIARGWPCRLELQNGDNVLRVSSDQYLPPISPDKINVGDVSAHVKDELVSLINRYRHCFALSVPELGCAKSGHISIELNDPQPFSYRPYRMARSEQDIVQALINDLLKSGIVKESSSPYASPVLLVKRAGKEPRLCIDYRKLNSKTVRDSHPLPRIDDQIDRLNGGVYFSSLDLKSGYHQLPVAESSQQYTSFVTPGGQYEYTRMPFGLTNAPRVFQRFMNRVLAPIRDFAAVYLDDILLHASTPEEALDHLEEFFRLLEEERLTLNLKKCRFLQTVVAYLGFEVSAGQVRPGAEKMLAVEQFPVPKNVHNIRQFLGLTGYFRHFVKDYARIAGPLTRLLQKDEPWLWKSEQQTASERLKSELVSRPTLAIYDPQAHTEVHTDASALGLGGILLQRKEGERLHPVAYYSRKCHGAEPTYHSYELETLAVVESVKKFRPYLIGLTFTVVTDCNSLKHSANKKQLIPRIARWWLQLQEYSFVVEYRPGDRMKHVDALSRNPIPQETVRQIGIDDWVLAGQMTDHRLQQIKDILSKPPTTAEEHHTYKNYCLRKSRVYRITPRGILWVVPRGMRHEIVRIAHEATGHCALDKTLRKLQEAYWFPKMREYVEEFLKCCIACLYNKRKSGKGEGFCNPIPKGEIPLDVLHIDHLGPFPKSRKRNLHLIVAVDAFTKFVFLRAVKSTKSKYTIEFLRDIFATYGAPKILISDKGTSFTSKRFKEFLKQNSIHHTENAVATPRGNGQVERFNQSILNALLTSGTDPDRWDERVKEVQFAINNTENSTTRKTPSQLLLGYTPRKGADITLRDEILQTSRAIGDLVKFRQEAVTSTGAAQLQQKKYYDRRRKTAREYKVGDLVLIIKAPSGIEPGTSRKLARRFQGPMIVTEVLPSDRYKVTDLADTRRVTRRSSYTTTVSADHMKPWVPPGGNSDGSDSENSVGDDVIMTSDNSDVEA